MQHPHKDLASLGLPPIDQVGFVVRNLKEAATQYGPLFGPFTQIDGSVEQAIFRGRKENVKLDILFGHSGELEIEFIQWREGNSPHREFIESGREGMHHLRTRVANADHWIEELVQIGYEPFWYKAFSPQITFAYLERQADPLVLEILQMP